MRHNAFGARWGSFSAPPDSLAAIGGGVPTSKGEGGEGNRKKEGRGWEGGREKGKGMGEGRGRTTCIPHYFKPRRR